MRTAAPPSTEESANVFFDLGAELFLDYAATIEGPREGITLSGNDQHRVILAIAGATLRRTSPAFNAVPGYCAGDDQRYVRRDEKCDAGAYEFNDFTKVAITIDNGVKVSSATGKAVLTGTIKCTRPDTFRLALELHQDQKVNGQVVDVHSASDIPVACSTSAKPWSAAMGLMPGEAFQAGAAKATAQTLNTAEWVTPASAAGGVKISFSRK